MISFLLNEGALQLPCCFILILSFFDFSMNEFPSPRAYRDRPPVNVMGLAQRANPGEPMMGGPISIGSWTRERAHVQLRPLK